MTPTEGAIADALVGGALLPVTGNVIRLPLALIAEPGIRDVCEQQGAVLGTSLLGAAVLSAPLHQTRPRL